MSHFVFNDHKHLILKARPKRSGRTAKPTYKRLEALGKQMAQPVRVNLLTGITKFKSKISDKALLEAWKQGSYGHLMETIPWQELPTDLEGTAERLQHSAYQSGLISYEALPAPVKSGLRYDVKNPAINRYINTRAAELVTNITKDTQTIVQQAVQRSFQQALRPDQVGRAIKGSIGLLPKHAVAVDNYRVGLEKNGFAPDKVDRLTAAYQQRLLNYRVKMIGRTETRFALNYGQLSIWKEASRQDLIDKQTAKKVWVTDGAPCEICDPMDGVGVGLDDEWELNNGDSVDIPTESHPQCECGMELDMGDGGEL